MSRRPRRLPYEQYRGKRRVFLTFCTKERRRHFDERALVALVTSQILRTADRLGFDVPAYCFMPDHVHLLVVGTRDDSDLLAFIRVCKQKTAFAARQTGVALWQPGAFDRTLRDDEDDLAVVDYIVNNPVRAGLVGSPIDWPDWGSQFYSRSELIDAIGARAPWMPRRG